MTLPEAAKQISDGIMELAPAHYEYELLKEVHNAYTVLTGGSVDPDCHNRSLAPEEWLELCKKEKRKERLELCKKILTWYDSTYHANTAKGKRKPSQTPNSRNNAETAQDTEKTKSGNSAGAGNLSRLLADLETGQEDQFDRDFSFGTLTGKTFLNVLMEETPEDTPVKPGLIYILELAVGFKMSEKTCNSLLETYGYIKIHAKNPLHIAVYVILKEMERQNDDERTGLFDQFDRIKTLLHSALTLMGEEERKNIPALSFEKELSFSSTTMLYNEALPHLNFDNYAGFIARHASELNEHYRKLLVEYKRLICVFYPLFFDGEKKESTSDPNTVPQQSWAGELTGVNAYSLFQFIKTYMSSVTEKRAPERLFTDFFKEGSMKNRPSREIMILLWLWEYCWMDAPAFRLPYRMAVKYLGEYAYRRDGNMNREEALNKLLYGENASAATGQRLNRLKSNDAIKKFPSAEQSRFAKYGVYLFDANKETFNSTPDAQLDIARLLRDNKDDTEKFLTSDEIRAQPAQNRWNGSDAEVFINSKLTSFGWQVLNFKSRFDRSFFELCRIHCNDTDEWRYDPHNQNAVRLTVPGYTSMPKCIPHKLGFVIQYFESLDRNASDCLWSNLSEQ